MKDSTTLNGLCLLINTESKPVIPETNLVVRTKAGQFLHVSFFTPFSAYGFEVRGKI